MTKQFFSLIFVLNQDILCVQTQYRMYIIITELLIQFLGKQINFKGVPRPLTVIYT